MQMPLSVLTWLLAVLPVAVLLFCFLKLRMAAPRAALCGLAAALLVAVTRYQSGSSVIVHELRKGLWSALPVVSVIITAILLYEICNQTGAVKTIGQLIRRFTADELLQILMIALAFSSFLQGISGFGVPVAVCAPLLLAIGVTPLGAVVLPPLGHAWGNSFGTLALAWDALIAQSGISGADQVLQTAVIACLMIWLWNFIGGLMICWFYGRWRALRHGFPAVVAVSLAQGGGQLAVSFLNTTLACFLPACLAILVLLLLSRMPRYRTIWRTEDSPLMQRSLDAASDETVSRRDAAGAFFPYVLLSLLTVGVLLVSPVFKALSVWKISISVPATLTGYGFANAAVEAYSPIAPLTHAAFFLLFSSLVTFCVHCWMGKLTVGKLPLILRNVLKKALSASLSVIFLLIMSKIMSGSGMTYMLALGFSDLLGRAYALLAPMIGLMGAFITSSNMASNILFAQFQAATAQFLHVKPALLLAAQTAGASIGSAVCPGTIVLGAMIAGMSGREGEILKKLFPPVLSVALLMGVITLAVALVDSGV